MKKNKSDADIAGGISSDQVNEEIPSAPTAFGGGTSIAIYRGEKASFIEKRHLVLNRVISAEAKQEGKVFYDMGTDFHYPFYADYSPTLKAQEAVSKYSDTIFHYPSSYGIKGLRESVQRFLLSEFSVALDRDQEIMINVGASQAFDALSRSFDGRYVFLPDLALPTINTISQANGAEVVRLPLQKDGFIDLIQAQEILDRLPSSSYRFLYLNSPCNPSGKVASWDYLKQLVKFAIRNTILILHDMDSWHTNHKNESLINILQIPDAKRCSISVFSISKEFGLPGLRIGFLAGNSEIINIVRMHNSIFCVMIPEVCQYAAKAALDSFDSEKRKYTVGKDITKILYKTIEGWKGLGWPENAISLPEAGYKYMIGVPPNIISEGGYSALELFDFFIVTRSFIKLSISMSFNPENSEWVRVIVMQNDVDIENVFDRLKEIGVEYSMQLPKGLSKEYDDFIMKNMGGDF